MNIRYLYGNELYWSFSFYVILFPEDFEESLTVKSKLIHILILEAINYTLQELFRELHVFCEKLYLLIIAYLTTDFSDVQEIKNSLEWLILSKKVKDTSDLKIGKKYILYKCKNLSKMSYVKSYFLSNTTELPQNIIARQY